MFSASESTPSIMVNPLLIVPLLNASTLKTTINGCYEQNPPGQIQLVPTTFIVCNQAINRIATGRALDRPLAFGRTVKVGHKLPDYFIHKGFYGACVIEIDMKSGEEDILTWRDVIIGANILRDTCVSIPPHLGGEKKAGPKQLMDIKMYGLDKDFDLASPVSSSGLVQGRVFEA